MSVIAVDLDGTAYQYHTAFVYMAREYLGVKMPNAWAWDSWDWPFQFMTDEQAKWMTEWAPTMGLYRYGHIMKGAIIGINKLAAGHEVIAVTHRPRVAVPDTLAWLTYADLPLSGVHILSEKQAKSSIQWDVLIDDRPENIEDAWGHARKGILFDQPWNKGFATRFSSNWKTMEETVNDALQA